MKNNPFNFSLGYFLSITVVSILFLEGAPILSRLRLGQCLVFALFICSINIREGVVGIHSHGAQ